VTTAVLTKVTATAERPAHDVADDSHPLLSVSWLDVSTLALEPDTHAEEALANLLFDEWTRQYSGTIADLQASHPDHEMRDPLDAVKREQLAMETRSLATGRLDLYEKRLRRFLETEPTEDQLVAWLADRAISDAGTWARMDALEIRQRATADFYDANPDLKAQKYRVMPAHAAEPKCGAIAGRVYPSFDAAQDALNGVTHRNCQHWVEPA